MSSTFIFCVAILSLGVFIGSISQVLLKKSALKKYKYPIQEYLNPLVIIAYILFIGTTFFSIAAYRGLPLSMGSLLETASYIYVTFWGTVIFKEKLNLKKLIALCLIISGIIISVLPEII